jgi:hypothetical protein
MRIIVRRKIYRAFPELDTYPDEQCERFVRAATRSCATRLCHAAVILAVFAAGLIVAVVVMVWTGGMVQRLYDQPGAAAALLIIPIAIMFIGLGVPPVAAYVARDLLLRRRLRNLLWVASNCPTCGYWLVGLPVRNASAVCPECGLTVEVDEALGELTLDGLKRARFTPRPPADPTLWQRLATPARRRRARLVLAWGAVAFVLQCLVLVIYYELFLRWQASVAAAERPGPAGVEAAMAAASAWEPEGPGPEPWVVLQSAIAETAAISEDVRKEMLPAGRLQTAGLPAHEAVAFGVSRATPWPQLLPQADWDRMRSASVEVARRARDAGVWMRVDSVASRPGARPRARFGANEPAFSEPGWSLDELRFVQLVRFRARASIAVGDTADYLDALRLGLGVARMTRGLASTPSASAAAMVEWDLHADAFDAALARPEPAFLDDLERLALDAADRPGLGNIIKGERVRALDSLAWHFEDPGRVRWGLRFEGQPRALPPLPDLWLAPLYHRQRRAVNTYFDAVSDTLRRRVPGPMILPPPPAWLAYQAYWPLEATLRSLDGAEAARRALLVGIAIERYRISNGTLPETLADLLPAHLPRIPDDPFFGEPLRYRATHTAPGYVLYSVGPFNRKDGVGERVPLSQAIWHERSVILSPTPPAVEPAPP